MALTLPVRMSCWITDVAQVQAIATAYAMIDPTASFDDITAFLNSWLLALEACTDGQIISADLTALPALPDGLKSAPVSGSQVEQTGVINFLATGSTHRFAALVPALSNSGTVISGGKIVLTGGAPVPSLVGVLLGGSGPLLWSNTNSQPLASLKDTLLTFREYFDQVKVASYET